MQMQISSAPLLTAAKLAELVALGHNRISQIYLHWTAGRYGQLYDDYHFNIDRRQYLPDLHAAHRA